MNNELTYIEIFQNLDADDQQRIEDMAAKGCDMTDIWTLIEYLDGKRDK